MIELLVVVAVTAVVLTIASPSLREMVETQRLRGVNAQLSTDLQFARSEAVTRNKAVRVVTGSNSTLTCYALVISADATLCDCTATPGSICTAPAIEVRTVQVNTNLGVSIGSVKPTGSALIFYPVNGGTSPYKSDSRSGPPVMSLSVDGGSGSRQKRLTTSITVAGRTSVCSERQYVAVTGIPSCSSSQSTN